MLGRLHLTGGKGLAGSTGNQGHLPLLSIFHPLAPLPSSWRHLLSSGTYACLSKVFSQPTHPNQALHTLQNNPSNQTPNPVWYLLLRYRGTDPGTQKAFGKNLWHK